MQNTKNEVVGWGDGSHWTHDKAFTASRKLGEAFHQLGMRDVFGVLGGGIAPFAHGVMQNDFRFFSFKHESGAGFAAVESYFATNRPAIVVVTTGPGLFNALTSMGAARADGAKVVLVSGASAREHTGRGAVQETSSASMPDPFLFQSGALFHFAAQPETIQELKSAMHKIQLGFKLPGGFVAHLSLPANLQTELVSPDFTFLGQGWTLSQAEVANDTLDECVSLLKHSRSAIWVGHGARFAWKELRELSALTQTPVLASPRAKGVFDELNPLYVGASGAGGHESVQTFFKEYEPETVFVLGSKLSEVTSFLQPWCVPTQKWVQVDLDPIAFGSAYPAGRAGLGIQTDCHSFTKKLLAAVKAEGAWSADRKPWKGAGMELPPALTPETSGAVRPAFVMQSLQKHVLTRPDVTVMSEAGNSFTWCNYLLRFSEPNQYRTSAAWGSMGHFTTGVVGAALSNGKPALAVVGDGSMLMNNEINTAVQYGARAIWVVLNDAQLGMNEHGMRALGIRPIETQMPRTDFVKFAESQGAKGKVVNSEADLDAALLWALGEKGPVVLDVQTDREAVSPILAARTKSLQNKRN